MMILHRLFPLLALLPFFFMAASSATSKELPRPLSERDADLYEQIFALQDDGEIKEAAKLIKQLDSQLLMGHVLAQKYLHPTAWRSSYTELHNGWINIMTCRLPAGLNGFPINAGQKGQRRPGVQKKDI